MFPSSESKAKMFTNKAYNQSKPDDKQGFANSCFISWFVFITFSLSLSLICLDSSLYKNGSFLAKFNVTSTLYNGFNSTTSRLEFFDNEGVVKLKPCNETVKKQHAVISDECLGKYIYVQHLPSKFNDDLIENCSTLNPWANICEYFENSGLGTQLENSEPQVFSDEGWFKTNQFSLEVIFHNRMKQYKCLTNDSSKAAAIFVPYYAGLDVGRYLWNSDVKIRDADAIEVVEYLKQQPEWYRMYGRDHFLVAGRITWDFRRESDADKGTDWGNCLFFLPEVKNMTSLLIESSPWNNTDFAIPYPTYFHPSNDQEIYSWQEKMRRKKRPYLFSFAGAPRPQYQDSIRYEIIDQCKSSVHCKFMKCETILKNCGKPRNIMRLFQRSVFCLQPAGDSFTRRSIFDSIIAGCIPVFFNPVSAYVQYLWHLPKNYTKYSVFIPREDVQIRNVSIEQRLLEISNDEVKAMREEVIRIIPKVVYANTNSKLETLEDAFDLSVKGVLNRIEDIRMAIKKGVNPTNDSFPEELSWKYNFFGGLDGHQEWDKYFERA